MSLTPTAVLKRTFGYDSFRPRQLEVIENLLARRDTLAIMPTGGGKSLCYQIPALIFSGVTVVVSPLIALMKDQVEQLRAAGVAAVAFNSSLSPAEYRDAVAALRRGEIKLIYAAPETLLTPRFLSLIQDVTVDCLTVDEAHCISEWGHDFRPEYRQLIEVRRRFPNAVCLALTATATPRVRRDILTNLHIPSSNEVIASFNRDNLYIEVVPKEDALRQTTRFLERFKDQAGIIYCFSRKQVDELAEDLQRKGYRVRPYHAGLADAERKNNQEAFIRDNVQIMVATVAFGMGINKPDVRFVIHYDLPKSIENYYQEIGRAGRDGLPAHCLLFYSYGDVAKLGYFIRQKEGEERQVAQQHLDALVRYAENGNACRRKSLLAYFGEPYTEGNCHRCDVCAPAPPALADVTIPAQKFLSCVKRTGERFDERYVAAVLLGKAEPAILANAHDQVSTYGIGGEYTEAQWLRLSKLLFQTGYTAQVGEDGLALTPKAMDALRSRAKIYGEAQAISRPPAPREKAPAAAPVAQAEEHNRALFALLRARRKELADETGVPPYVIFSDKTLIEMATYYPQSTASLLRIAGVGEVKAERYGGVFVAVIRDFCKKKGLKERVKKRTGAKKTRGQ